MGALLEWDSRQPMQVFVTETVLFGISHQMILFLSNFYNHNKSQNFRKSFQLLRIKIRIACTPVWNKLPVNHTFKIPPDTQHYFGAEPIFFNDGFGGLTGTESLFRGVRVAVMDPFFITCDNEMTDKLKTDIHSTISLLR